MKAKFQTYWSYFSRLSPVLMVIFILLWLKSCHGEAEQTSRYEDNLKAKESVIRSYKLANGQLADEKDLLLVTKKELREQIWFKDDSIKVLLEKLKDPVVVIKWKTKYVYKDTLYVPFETPVDFDFQRSFNKTDTWYSVTGSVDQTGLKFTDVSIPNTQRLVVGYKKGKPVITVTNSNPHLITEEIEGQVVDVPKRYWGIGVFVGFNVLLEPIFGAGVTYDLIQF